MGDVEKTLAAKAPITARTSSGVWTGRTAGRAGRQRWLYRRLPAEALLWEDPAVRNAHAARLQDMFARFAAAGGREVHLLALRWDAAPGMPAGSTAAHRELLDPVFASFSRSVELCAVGVRLKTADRSGADAETMDRIFALAGAQPLTEPETLRVEAWWAGGLGRHADAVFGSVPAGPDRVDAVVRSGAYPDGFTFSTLVDAASLAGVHDDSAMWASGLLHSGDAACAVSVRGVATADVAADDWLRLRRCSVVIAHRVPPNGGSGVDGLRHLFGIETRTVPVRLTGDALAETAPLAAPRVGVSPADAAVAARVVSRSGIVSGGGVGDRDGVWIGTAPPTFAPVWVDPDTASGPSVPPVMGVFGDPGAGKTFLMRLIAAQAAAAGRPVMYVNTKTADSCRAFVDAVGGELVAIPADAAGMFDPFRFSSPETAAAIAADHLELCFAGSLTAAERTGLRAGLLAAARTGAGCVGEALRAADIDAHVAEMVRTAAATNPLLGLAVAAEPTPRWEAAPASTVTAVEFERQLTLPADIGDAERLDRPERSAVAAVRLTVRAAWERISVAGGGVLIVDEADPMFAASEIRWMLQHHHRHGSGGRVCAVFGSQKPSQVAATQAEIAPGLWLGRVMAMGLTDPAELDAVLALCGVEPTAEERREFLRQAGPVADRADPARSRGALALHRDANRRLSAVLVGPDPGQLSALFGSGPQPRVGV